MTVVARLVLEKVFQDDDPSMKEAFQGWDCGGWVLRGATLTTEPEVNPQAMLAQMLERRLEAALKRVQELEERI